MPSDPETIVYAIADGLSVPDAAQRFGVTEEAVRGIIKEATDRYYDGAYMREAWMLEARRLEAVGMKFYHKAMDEADPQAAIVFVKTSERRATLAGANAPAAHAVRVMHQAAPVQQTSTDKLRGLLDNIMHITPRERELLDHRELEGDDSPETLAEINELRAARGKGPYGEDD